jgi:4-alpha-glucanotransferase
MRILQFAFDGGADNPYLPHNHGENSVVYTGTHDNDTTVAWFEGLPVEQQCVVLDYLGHPGESMPWPLIRAALAHQGAAVIDILSPCIAFNNHKGSTKSLTVEHIRPTLYWQVPITTPGSEFLSANHGDNCGSVPSDLLVCKASTHISPKASRGSRVR